MDNTEKKAMVILDVDGVLNSFSNHRFYMQFICRSLRCLSKIHGRRELIKAFPKLKKMGGANSLFAFARDFCGSDENFNKFKSNFINGLNFDLISHDPSMREMIKRLGQYGDICIRSDGLEEVGVAIWKRVIENVPSAKIKLDKFNDKSKETYKKLCFDNKTVIVSGIIDNNFRLKRDIDSWKIFSDNHNISIPKSVLLDDSRNNTNVAQNLGMTTVHISVLDSLLQKSHIGSVFGYSLSDVLGKKMSKALKKYQISYGKEVKIKELFLTILGKKIDTGQNKTIPAFVAEKDRV